MLTEAETHSGSQIEHETDMVPGARTKTEDQELISTEEQELRQ